ncbi:MAG TPA: gluconeogenesis factor YvcK family protein [Candidatus Saccharimonadales bacterium]|nr:gluconeogenesis factor YvcK family protein [Candidatus Saccharimonadales bacterium]
MNDPFVPTEIKIAVIGGGTGSFTLLSALKDHTSQIAALVNMADDGGSTGVLRDELGALPPGDVRQCLVALSRTPEIRDLFNYRFEEGSLKGHAFGNLFLTALEKMNGNFADGVSMASDILNIVGVVEPITLSNVRLAMEAGDGEVVHGEFVIAHRNFNGCRPRMWLEPNAEANPAAIAAITQADIVVIAPGNLYGSLAPALIVPGIGEALAKTKALKVYVCNLVTKPGQTDGFQVNDFADEIERLAGGKFLDHVLYNTEAPSSDLLSKYAKEGELSVVYDEADLKEAHYAAFGANLLSGTIWENTNRSDPIAATRTLIRHDPQAVAKAIMDLYKHARTDD